MKRSFFLFAVLVLLSCSSFPPLSETVVFLHSNDTHGIYKSYKFMTQEGEEWIGGMEAVCHYLDAVRKEEKNVLYIETGDIMTGTIATECDRRVHDGISQCIGMRYLVFRKP
jgi:2',3'-cyclic-nucleotide 2'-phosphodiesterase (5'-nucleotidase family)